MSTKASDIPSGVGVQRAPRLLHLDWLRVLAMMAIFLYHNMRAYDFDDWHIKNAVTTQTATSVVEVCNLWMMPLFFVLSSAAIYYSMRSRTAGQFVRERFLRIAVPWLGLGMFVFGPLQIYLDRLSHGDFHGSFVQFLPHYFDGFYGINGNFAWMGVHLWYLMMLFLFCLIMLPFLRPRGEARQSLLARLSPVCRHTPVLILMFVPLALASLLTDALDMGMLREFGSWDTFSYLLFFTYGYLLHADSGVQATVDRLRVPSAITAVVLVLVTGALEPSAAWYWAMLRSACAWFSILAILGFGHRYLNFSNRFVVHANEAVLPFYILHQPVIVSIAFFVVQLDAAPPLKYFLTVGLSFVVIVALYEFLVRRFNVLRALFGMRLKPARA